MIQQAHHQNKLHSTPVWCVFSWDLSRGNRSNSFSREDSKCELSLKMNKLQRLVLQRDSWNPPKPQALLGVWDPWLYPLLLLAVSHCRYPAVTPPPVSSGCVCRNPAKRFNLRTEAGMAVILDDRDKHRACAISCCHHQPVDS